MSLTPIISASNPVFHFRNHVYIVPVCTSPRPSILFHCNRLKFAQLKARTSEESCGNQSVSASSRNHWWPNLARPLVDLSATSLLLLALGIYAFSFSDKRSNALAAVNAAAGRALQEDSISKDDISGGEEKNVEDEQLLEEFENWKSKTYALTVPLRVVALQGSVPPAWIKDFIQSQGRRLKFSVQFRGSLEDIFSELLGSSGKANASPKSAIAADLITIGDSWLDLAIGKSIIEPLENAEDCDWFKNLADIWKVYLRRNNEGKIDPEGRTWAVPYRWGSMVIAYKKNKFDRFGLAPIEDWKDLWRPELAGKISMIDSPREIVGAVLKYMGASYNTNDISKEIPGGISSVQQNLLLLAKQVLLFDSGNYLKAFNISDSWVAVGWSSDILPAAKRMSNVAVVVPKSGASLWADLWAIPATTRCPPSEDFGGRVRGPSPVIHQWLDFCQQPAQELPFKQGVFPGASPSALADVPSDASKVLPKGAPELVTNLIAGIPPPEILAKCEFLEPLSEATLSDYNWLISTMKESDPGPIQQFFSTIFQASWTKFKFLRGENR